MEATVIIALINALVSAGMQIWSSARKIYGDEVIPSWEDILAKNQELQNKIDAELV